MSKGHLRAVWNKLPAVHSNSMYGVYVNEKELASPSCVTSTVRKVRKPCARMDVTTAKD
jgi:hypothetical protein